MPTHTPVPINCVPWLQAGDYVGKNTCVCGVVTATYDDPGSSAFFINFSSDRIGYYAVSFNHTFTDIEGICVRICGTVDIYKDRPQTVIASPEQVQEIPACP